MRYSYSMEVFVEGVLVDNFCLDFLLSYCTLLLTKNKPRYGFLALSSLVGSGFALLSPLITKFELLFKFGVLLTGSAIFYGKKDLRGYCIVTFCYAILSFLLSGLITFLLGGKLFYSFIGVKKGGVIAVFSAGTFLFIYSVRQIGGLIREKKRENKKATAVLVLGEKKMELSALYDSGNLLTDEAGAPVILIDEKRLCALGSFQKTGKLTVHTVSGSKELNLVKIPEIKIYSGGEENTFINVTAALTELPKEYSVILPYE